jgi:WD40 repeat protein
LCLAVSADGKKLAAGGCDRLVRVWDLSPGYANAKLEQSIENHADWVFGVAFAPDGKHLLTASRDKTAKVWDLATKESVLTFPDHQNTVYSVAVKSDGKLAYSVGEDNQLRTWNAQGEGKQVRASGGHAKAVFKVVRHPTQPFLATCSADQTVRLWNLDNGAAVRTMSGHTDWVYTVAFSLDGNFIASGSWNGEVKVWKTADGSLIKSFNASPGLATLANSASTSPAPKK